MNTVGLLIDAYYGKLNGNVHGFGVYKLMIPISELSNFIRIYPESGSDNNNKSKFIEDVIIVVEIVSIFKNMADQAAVEDADSDIRGLLFNGNNSASFSITGVEIRNFDRDGYTYTITQDQSNTFYTKVTRYKQRLIQT